MAKHFWPFTVLNKETSTRDGFVKIQHTKSGNEVCIALNHCDYEWGDFIDYNLTDSEYNDAIDQLETHGWI